MKLVVNREGCFCVMPAKAGILLLHRTNHKIPACRDDKKWGSYLIELIARYQLQVTSYQSLITYYLLPTPQIADY